MSKGLNDYVTLGRSGLRVSPLCLGTMTFGTEWGWGSEEEVASTVFDRYVDAGGNFLDTADAYTDGHSEELLGEFIRDRGLRDRVVLATKFTFNAEPGNPNAGGNGRKNIYRALEGSLRRLQTDYIDLYWLHAWDTVTPPEEVVSTLNDLVRAGKIRHYGFSDVPAWYVARAQTIAEKEGKERPIARYSLNTRSSNAISSANTFPRRAGTWTRNLPMESIGRWIPQWKVSAPGKHWTGRRPAGRNQGNSQSGFSKIQGA